MCSHLPPHLDCGYPWNNITVFYSQSRFSRYKKRFYVTKDCRHECFVTNRPVTKSGFIFGSLNGHDDSKFLLKIFFPLYGFSPETLLIQYTVWK